MFSFPDESEDVDLSDLVDGVERVLPQVLLVDEVCKGSHHHHLAGGLS